MRITTEEVVAGHSAMRVRGFLRRFKRGFFTLTAAEGFMQLKSRQAAKFIDDMVALELIELIMPVRDTLCSCAGLRNCLGPACARGK
jgi:hypothetical protein